MQIIEKSILAKLYRPAANTHKGQNGRVLIIAGSSKYHGALLMAVQTASRAADMVYVHSAAENLQLINQLKSEICTFISVEAGELWETVELVDSFLIGPGLEESKNTKKILNKILTKYNHKKTVIDATALWLADPDLLHHNCVVTPHSREFEKLFNCDPTPDNVLKMAKYYQCVVVLKGQYDYVSDGRELYENRTGNVGMTKGGTGDVVSGLTAALAAKNDVLTAALSGIYLTGLAGDKLQEKNGTFYNAEDVIRSLGEIWQPIWST